MWLGESPEEVRVSYTEFTGMVGLVLMGITALIYGLIRKFKGKK